jgi:hypothetical protein
MLRKRSSPDQVPVDMKRQHAQVTKTRCDIIVIPSWVNDIHQLPDNFRIKWKIPNTDYCSSEWWQGFADNKIDVDAMAYDLDLELAVDASNDDVQDPPFKDATSSKTTYFWMNLFCSSSNGYRVKLFIRHNVSQAATSLFEQ